MLKTGKKHTFSFFICFCLFSALIGRGGEAFLSPLLNDPGSLRKKSEETFNSSRKGSGAAYSYLLKREEEIINALSGSIGDENSGYVSDPVPQIKALSKRLKELIKEEDRSLIRKKAGAGDYIIKTREGTAIFIKEEAFDQKRRGKLLYEDELDASSVYDKAIEWLELKGYLLGLDNPAEEMEKESVWKDGLGIWHIKFKQVFKGIEVFGSRIILHYNPRTMVFCLSGRYYPTPDFESPDTGRIISATDAVEAVKGYKKEYAGIDTEEQLVCFFDAKGTSHLAWRIHGQKDISLNRDIFVHARTGSILHEIERICHSGGPALGTGEDLYGIERHLNAYKADNMYYLVDTTKDMFKPYTSAPPYYFDGGIFCFDLRNQDITDLGRGGKIYFFTSADNRWNDPYAVSAMHNASLAYDYFKETFGLKSFDGEGRNIYILIHFGEGYNNAGWNGHFVILGDGDGEILDRMPAALDVITHELGHAVVDYRANFIYQGQSGALHEAFADFFGIMSDPDDWTIGEDIVVSHIAVRDISRPSRPGLLERLPEHMKDYEELPVLPEFDFGGVHRNVGIINRATYLIITSLGRPQTEQIYFRALDVYLTRYSEFIDLKLALAQSAQDLYGQAARDVVEEAFSTVGILGNEPSSQPGTVLPVGGEGWILYVNPYDLSLWMIRGDGKKNQRVTYTMVKGRPAVTKNGKILFIDQANNIRGIDLNTLQERVLSNAGIWKSIAISPDLESFSVTVRPNIDNFSDSQKIYWVSLGDEADNIKQITLKPPNTMENGQGVIGFIFPGDMDFSYDGQYILFDAYHVLEMDAEHMIKYWDIDRVRVPDNVVDRPLPSLGSNFDIGNPIFAKGSFTILAYDLYIKDKGIFRTLITDTQSGNDFIIKEGPVREDLGLIGACPSFSQDNRHVVYQYFDEKTNKITIRMLELNESLSGIKDDTESVVMSEGRELEGLLPTWFQLDPTSNGNEGDNEGEVENNQDSGTNQYVYDKGLFKEDKGGCFISSLKLL